MPTAKQTNSKHDSQNNMSYETGAKESENPEDDLMFSRYAQQVKNYELLNSIPIKSITEVNSIKKIQDLLPLVDEKSQEIFNFICEEINLEKHFKLAGQGKLEIDLGLINILASFYASKFVLKQTIKKRKPVICVMGHVDHGKTTLLDYYRNTRKAQMEVGGITQKIGGFTMATKFGEVSFIDTPGHAIFSNMRQTGAFLADIAILIISAVEGIQPQTLEVLKLIKHHGLPFVVAINKIDAQGSDPEAVEESLVEHGVNIEPYGGEIPVVHISAKSGKNVELLLELLIEEANRLQLKADYSAQPECLVLETAISASNDLRKTSVLVKNGQVKNGSHIFFTKGSFKVLRINDDLARNVDIANPGDIVEIAGITEYPNSTERLYGTNSDANAKLAVELNKSIKNKFFKEEVELIYNDFKIKLKTRRERSRFRVSSEYRKEKIQESLQNMKEEMENLSQKTKKIDDLGDEELDLENPKNSEKTMMTDEQSAAAQKLEHLEKQTRSINFLLEELEDKQLHNPILIKVSNIGTKDTIQSYLERLETKNFTVVDITCGQITEHDVTICKQVKGKIVIFDLPTTEECQKLLRESGVGIISHNIIYKLFEELESWKGLEETQSHIAAKSSSKSKSVVKKIFSFADSKGKEQQIAGVHVENGKLTKSHTFRLIRKGKLVANNLKISSLKRFKEEVNQIEEGQDCGLSFVNHSQFMDGDVIEGY